MGATRWSVTRTISFPLHDRWYTGITDDSGRRVEPPLTATCRPTQSINTHLPGIDTALRSGTVTKSLSVILSK